MVQAILTGFRETVGEYLEEAEFEIYARHIRELVTYVQNIVQRNEKAEMALRPILLTAVEIGYQLGNRQTPLPSLQQLEQRLRQEFTAVVLQQVESQPAVPDGSRRLMDAAMVIADFTHHLEIGYLQCQNDDQVRDTQNRYNALLDSLPVTFVVYDKNEVCVFANKTCYEDVKKKPEQIIGRTRSELSGRYNHAKEPEDVWERVRAGERVKVRLEFFGEDGLWLHDKELIPLTDAKGDVDGFITVSYPATSEKERLYHLQKQFSFVLNSMNSGLMILNRESVVTGFNKRAEDMFGVQAEEVLGQSLYDLYQKHVGANMEAYDYLVTVMEDGVPIRRIEHSLHVDGRALMLRVDGNPIKNAHGVVVGYILIIDDQTELVAMREAMIRNEKFALIGQFAAGIAHEIRNPLTTVFGFLQLFVKRSVHPENFLDLTEKLLIPEIDRANTILSDFLMVSKPQAPQRTRVDTATFFGDVVRLVESEAHLRGVLLQVEAPEELPPLQLDVQQMKQVFLNLCKNGFDVTPPGGCLTLRVEVDQQAVRFAVIDEGPGIQMQDLSRIFEPFFTTKEHGTGLGLPISHRLVEGHGGTLQVRSCAGGGTTFLITLPVTE